MSGTTTIKPAVRLTDSTLRDGSHAVRHQFTEQDVVKVSGALDAAGLQVIEQALILIAHSPSLYLDTGTARRRGRLSAPPEASLLAAARGLARSWTRATERSALDPPHGLERKEAIPWT